MATLGDILGAARRSAGAFEGWLSGADPALAEDVASAAGRFGTTPAGFARLAVADFSRYADEEDWAGLTRVVRDEQDAGTACLAAMVQWRLAVPDCEHQHHHG